MTDRERFPEATRGSTRFASRRSVLAGMGTVLVGSGAVSSFETDAFDVALANRTSNVSVVDDDSAYVGLFVSDTVQRNQQELLAEITNNTDETLDITVELNDPTQGTIYGPDGSGDSVSLTLDPGVVGSVDIEATVSETVHFTVTATAPGVGFEIVRSTEAVSGNTDAPTADAGGPYSVDEGNDVELDGTGSSGNIQSYSWNIVDGPGSLTDADTSTPTYHAPSVDEDTTVEVELTVTNNKGISDSDTATITVNDVAEPPTIDSLSITVTGTSNRRLTIDASVSDADGDLSNVEIRYWESSKNNPNPTVVNFGVQGSSDSISYQTDQLKRNTEYTVEVTVTDEVGLSDSETRTKQTGS